ncbi:Sialomucin core protein 24 [Halotydeus destructor]|nr:Sialomucin core protein 24 [Halotydeus destructor]
MINRKCFSYFLVIAFTFVYLSVAEPTKPPPKCDPRSNCSDCLSTNCAYWSCSGNASICLDKTVGDTNDTYCNKAERLTSCPGGLQGSPNETTTTESPLTTVSPTTTSSTTSIPTGPSSSTLEPTAAPQRSSTSSTIVPSRQNSGQGRGFHGPSFVGGMVMAFGMMAISFVAFKYHKVRTERNYLTL